MPCVLVTPINRESRTEESVQAAFGQCRTDTGESKGKECGGILQQLCGRSKVFLDCSSELLLVDSDPQLFLGLLKVSPESKASEFLASNNVEENVLKDYLFNLPNYMKGRVERILDRVVIDSEAKFKMKNTIHQ